MSAAASAAEFCADDGNDLNALFAQSVFVVVLRSSRQTTKAMNVQRENFWFDADVMLCPLEKQILSSSFAIIYVN
jgi:hypothetical protein